MTYKTKYKVIITAISLILLILPLTWLSDNKLPDRNGTYLIDTTSLRHDTSPTKIVGNKENSSNNTDIVENRPHSFDTIQNNSQNDTVIIESQPVLIDTFQTDYENNNIRIFSKVFNKTGRVSYQIPDKMIVDETYRIELIISEKYKEQQLVEMVASFTDTAKISTETISIGNDMKVSLISPYPVKQFHITPLSNETQSIKNKELTLWQWDVVPLLDGKSKLILNVEILINNKEQSIPVFDKEINIVSKSFDYGFLITLFVLTLVILVFLILIIKQSKKSRTMNEINSNIVVEIKKLITENKTKQALDKLEKYLRNVDNDLHNQIIMHQANYISISQQADLNTISFADAKQSFAQINFAILRLLDKL